VAEIEIVDLTGSLMAIAMKACRQLHVHASGFQNLNV